jgi:hypothetical protein
MEESLVGTAVFGIGIQVEVNIGGCDHDIWLHHSDQIFAT